MKALLYTLACWALLTPAHAQTTAQDLIKQGVQLYDSGQYGQAVDKYQRVLATEPDNVLANTELALTYNAMEKYKDAAAICEKLLKAAPTADASVYVTYGNSLDALTKTKAALQVYAQGLKYHPDSYALYYNQGVAQATSGLGPASIASFQRAVALNPAHASSHMSLGVMQLNGQARVPAILALARFLVLEPRSARAMQRLPLLAAAMTQGVTRTGAKAVNIAMTVEDVQAVSRHKDQPDNFGMTEMILNLVVARTISKDSGATTLSRFAEQFSAVCQSLADPGTAAPTGFTWQYYAPYFAAMEKKGFVPAFTYLAHSSQADAQPWLAAHPAEVQVFQEWSKNYEWPEVKP